MDKIENLVIVESPNKCKSIEEELGSGYKVVASKGHIREIADGGHGNFNTGIDIEKGFVPKYMISKNKKDVVAELKDLCSKSENIYLATDPDREGEAISWHLKEVLGLKDKDYKRVEFYELTKKGILEGINNPRKIDEKLFESQEARSVLDKLMGYPASQFVRTKVGGVSAGRVQSVALKYIVDREKEIQAFVPEAYYKINAYFNELKAELVKYNGEKIEIKSKEEADKILDSLSKTYNIVNVTEKEKVKESALPFNKASLSVTAINVLGMSARKVQDLSQKLFESHLITYPRSDDYRISDDFAKECFEYIEKKYGKEYVGVVKNAKKGKNVQGAHEAIRPAEIIKSPDVLSSKLPKDQLRLYTLIYNRTLASLMSGARYISTVIELENNKYIFKAEGKKYIHDGYFKVLNEKSDEVIVPYLKGRDTLDSTNVEATEHFTEAPSRYSEASLIKKLEDDGIGRPSTYDSVIATLEDKKRDFTTLDNKRFVPTQNGINVSEILDKYFSDFINVTYTSKMEEDLDDIAQGESSEKEILQKFWDSFLPTYDYAKKNAEKLPDELTGENCPKCGKPMVYKKNKSGGKFEACSGYPDCEYIKQEETGEKCPECGKAMIYAFGPYGKYERCSECEYIKHAKVVKTGEKCPKCGHDLVIRYSKGSEFVGCSGYPNCRYIKPEDPVETGEKCPECGKPIVRLKGKYGPYEKCSSCNYKNTKAKKSKNK